MAKQRVLIPLDDSAFSRNILPHVQKFFVPERCEIILFRVARAPRGEATSAPPPVRITTSAAGGYFSPSYAAAPDASPESLYGDQEWRRFAATLKGEFEPDQKALQKAGYTVNLAVHFGNDPAKEIVHFAEEEGIDLVAMATHGRTGLGRLLRGSVAEGVLHQLAIPVLLLRVSKTMAETAVTEDAPS
jgi:nucleotide-binding universal stress UspA family protein